MARLNEPPAPMESNLDILRRKFLRQNRDLARVNSNQSNRIRILENEYARLLSDNLDLRGQVMRLQKELENDTTRRVADQAMEIKARMEAKLAELGSMLATFGDEPPAKRHSPERKMYIKASPRSIRKTAQRKPREIVDQDALAAQEGRLPPIYENKPVARATMNSAEIMALCAEAADTSYSPDIGPPPVLRSVEENTIESSSPAKPSDSVDPRKRIEDGRLKPENMVPVLKLDYQGKTPGDPDQTKVLATEPIRTAKPEKVADTDKVAAPTAPISTLRAGAKRKYGDENETAKPVKSQPDKPQADKENEVVNMGKEKAADSKGRMIKDIASRKEPRLSNKAARPALSAKSANDDVSTPRKASRDHIKPAKAAKTSQTLDNILAREREKRPLTAPVPPPVLELHIPPPTPEPPIAVTAVLPDSLFELDPEPEQEPEASRPPSIAPDTPDRPAPHEAPADTPPPGYLALNGETARPSRRARSAVSYAEPNLRDKMRRPTKELFDAVAGEGKFKHRTSINATGLGLSGSTESAPTSTIKPISGSTESPRETVAPSPSAQRGPAIDTAALSNSISTDRRKRPSVIGTTRDQQPPTTINFENLPHAPPPKPRPSTTTASTKPAATDDIYDFSSTSPAGTAAWTSEPKETTAKPRRQQLRRASAAAAHQALRDYAAAADDDDQSGKQSASSRGHARKRASMLAPKKTPMAEMMMLETGEGGGDSSMGSSFSSFEEVEEVSGTRNGEEEMNQRERDRRKRVDRRRSMML